jgi:hypothetical protein
MSCTARWAAMEIVFVVKAVAKQYAGALQHPALVKFAWLVTSASLIQSG